MRYRNLDLVFRSAASAPLIATADAARAEILNEADPNRRKELIVNHRVAWVAFRPLFAGLSHNKCWYTESVNPGTDDDVDHFRPKGRLAEDGTHAGYWWEALNWRNFRLSCHRGNRLRINPETGDTHGKGDHFPLIDESRRCRTPGDDIHLEGPLLLDPTDPADPPLLTFAMDGSAALSPLFDGDVVALQRVEASRIVLHLDWPPFKAQRRDLYFDIHEKVARGDEHWSRPADIGSKLALKDIVRDLISLTRDEKPYSCAARSYLHLFRTVKWVERLVLPQCG